MKVHAGFGKQVLVVAEINWLAATTIQTSRVLQGFCFQSTSNSSGEEMSSGTLEKSLKKNCLRWWDIHFTLAKPKRRRLQLDSVIIRALKQGYFLRFVMQDELGSLAWWNEGEGRAEIREDGADGGSKVSTQVSVLPQQLCSVTENKKLLQTSQYTRADRSLKINAGSRSREQYADVIVIKC